MDQRKATSKQARNQDLTDHGALRGQLHIRTANLERHGSQRDWKAEKSVTEIENLCLQNQICIYKSLH